MILKHLCCIFTVIFISAYFDGTFAHTVERRQVQTNSECTPLEDIPNGNYIVLSPDFISPYTSGSPVPNNSVIGFGCDSNYELSPLTYITKCVDGTWDKEIPTCVPKGSLNEAVEEERSESDQWGSWDVGFQAPWHVGIYQKKNNDNYGYLCGGSIISSNVIVTAAHCLTDDNNRQIPPTKLYIAAGKTHSNYDTSLDWASQHSQVKSYRFPEEYKGPQSNLKGDLALLILINPLNIGYYVHPVYVDWENRFEDQQLTPGNIGYVQGWGYTNIESKTPSETLQQLGVPFVNRQDCLDVVPRNFYEYVTDDKFCAGFTNGSCVCNGDDGGGLVFPQTERGQTKYYIRGLISTFPKTGGACDIHQYAVYTKISAYKNFIQNVVNENKVKKPKI